ncbi:MAG TPA: RidA family protein [Actinomycetota bacterium]|nr:RidA family protein [Actinomycetota bacterium]
MRAEERLRELGIELPEPPEPVAAYIPWVAAGGLIFVSGQIPSRDGGLPRTGHVGAELTIDEGAEEARFCALNVLAQLRAAAGSLDLIGRVVRLGVFVSSAPGFTHQPAVANGASELMKEVFGEEGKHARTAVGVSDLPLGAPVEVDAIAALES